jgi:hypothetical protein
MEYRLYFLAQKIRFLTSLIYLLPDKRKDELVYFAGMQAS